jgi:formate dehydrogenase major subunit
MSGFSNGRLTTPLIRTTNGHRTASWEEALDCVASRLKQQIERHGPRAFGMFSCSKTTNELNYVAQKFVRAVVGCNNIDSCNRT